MNQYQSTSGHNMGFLDKVDAAYAMISHETRQTEGTVSSIITHIYVSLPPVLVRNNYTHVVEMLVKKHSGILGYLCF